jgi:hypothetical protein
MAAKLQETSGNMPVERHLIDKLGIGKGTWTAESLGLEIDGDRVAEKGKSEKVAKKVGNMSEK